MLCVGFSLRGFCVWVDSRARFFHVENTHTNVGTFRRDFPDFRQRGLLSAVGVVSYNILLLVSSSAIIAVVVILFRGGNYH